MYPDSRFLGIYISYRSILQISCNIKSLQFSSCRLFYMILCTIHVQRLYFVLILISVKRYSLSGSCPFVRISARILGGSYPWVRRTTASHCDLRRLYRSEPGGHPRAACPSSGKQSHRLFSDLRKLFGEKGWGGAICASVVQKRLLIGQSSCGG